MLYPHEICHVYGYAGWAGEITVSHLNPLPHLKKILQLPVTVFRGVNPWIVQRRFLCFLAFL